MQYKDRGEDPGRPTMMKRVESILWIVFVFVLVLEP